MKVANYEIHVGSLQARSKVTAETVKIIVENPQLLNLNCFQDLRRIFVNKTTLPVFEPEVVYGMSLFKNSNNLFNTYDKFMSQSKKYKADDHLWFSNINEEKQYLCVRIHYDIREMLNNNGKIDSTVTLGTRKIQLTNSSAKIGNLNSQLIL